MGKTALVFSGGAARGAYELGVWKALKQLKVPIDIVTGTSIGAVNGAMLAQEDFEIAQALWNSLESNKLFNMQPADYESLPQKIRYSIAKISTSLFQEGGSDVRLLLSAIEPYLDEAKIRRSKIDFGLVTINIDKKTPLELVIEDIPKGQLLDYIYASCSVRPLFKPYVIDEQRFVDGCYYDNMPISLALKKGAERIIAVNLEAFGYVNKKLLKTTPNLTLIRSHWDLGPTFFFDTDTVKRNTQLGYLDGLKALQYYDGQAYAFLPGTAKLFWERLLKAKKRLPFLDLDKRESFFQENRRASKTLFLHLRKRLINKLGIQHLILAWAENAGELFEIDPCQVYDFATFNQLLYERYSETSQLDLPSLPDIPGFAEIDRVMGDTGINGFSALRLQLSLFKDSIKNLIQKEIPQKINKRSTTKYFLGLLREHLNDQQSLALANLAALMPNEFLAAMYILWLEDFYFKEPQGQAAELPKPNSKEISLQ